MFANCEQCFRASVATPEQKLFCDSWRGIEGGEDEFWKDGVYGHAGFLRVEEQTVSFELVLAEVHSIADDGAPRDIYTALQHAAGESG